MPAVAHLYAHDGPPTAGVTTSRDLDPTSGAAATGEPSTAAPGIGTLRHTRPGSITEVDENTDSSGDDAGDGGGEADGAAAVRAAEATGQGANVGKEAEVAKAAEAAAGKLVAGAAKEREKVMSMSTVVLQEAKRNKRFRFFSEER